MFIVLTNSKTKRKTIVNWNQVQTCYELYDREIQDTVTKIFFNKDSNMIVTEKLNEIHHILNRLEMGLEQNDIKWDEVPTFDEVIENSYRPRFERRKNYRETNYNY